MQVKNGQANIYNGLTVSGSSALRSSGSTILSIDGASGRLFSVDDSLSGSLFSVNTAAGLPVMEAFSDNTVRVGQYGTLALFVSKSRVGIGKESGLNANLDVVGTAIVSGSAVGSPAFYVTNGGVQFGSTTGFVWDAANSRLGIGTSSPGAPLQVNGIILANNGSVRIYAPGPSSFSFFVAYPDESNTDNYKIITRGNGLFASRNFMKLGATSYAELTTNPTAVLELYGSTTSNASLRIRSGSAPTSPNDGDIWYSGSQIVFRAGLNASGSTSIIGSGSSLLTIDGVSGRLFQVDDSLSGSLFSVNNSTGLPLIEAFSDDTIRMGQFGTRTLFVSQSRVGIGTETPNKTLTVSGSVILGNSTTPHGNDATNNVTINGILSLKSGYLRVDGTNVVNLSNSSFTVEAGVTVITNGISGYNSSDFTIKSNSTSYGVNLNLLTNTYLRVSPTTGNVIIQNAGTFTDSNYRLQVKAATTDSGSLLVSGSTVMSGSLDIVGPSLQIATISSTNATATRLAINHISATPNSGFVLQTNGVNNWSLANYVPSGTNASFVFYNDRTNTDSLFINGDTNNVGIRTNSPTARLDIPASVTSSASLRIRSGSAPTSPNDGDIWFDGTNLYMRIAGSTKTFTMA